MTDQPAGNNPEGQVASAPAQVPVPATNEPSPITAKDLADFETRIDRKFAQLYQGVQSREDKFSAKMQKIMKGYEDNAAKLGIQLTDADKQVLQNNAKYQILSETSSSTGQPFVYQPGQAIPQGLTDDELAASVEAAADALFKANQVEIKRGDPEDALLAAAEEKSPDEYLSAVQQAINAKKARIGTSATAQPATQPATNFSPGLVGGKPQSNPIQDLSRDELWSLAKKKLG